MSVFHPHSVKCVCGNLLTVMLADSVNVSRSPELRARILSGDMHRVTCPKCDRTATVEKGFYYSDGERNLLYRVAPKSQRHTWKEKSRELDKAATLLSDQAAARDGLQRRVIFGLDELREKLVAQDAGIDDRIVELLKVLLVYEHPILLRRPRLRFTLEKAGEAGLDFIANYEHDQHSYKATLPAQLAGSLVAAPGKLSDWTAKVHKASIFKLPDHWVNMWRWSPQPSALDLLRNFAEAVAANRAIDTEGADFRQMLGGLPRGTHLPPWAKRDLRTLFEYAKRNNLQKLEDQLFEIRFGKELEDDWSTNADPNDIDTIWKLLQDLPETNVEGNTSLHEIMLLEGQGGGFYQPDPGDIEIGDQDLGNQEYFEDTVRHEVGHAVHASKRDLVGNWLAGRFGWALFDPTDDGIDAWVGQMGGWGTLTEAQRADVRGLLKNALGAGSSWTPGPMGYLPQDHPWYRADFGPRLAFEKTGPWWYRNFRTWHRANGKAFFMNFWYAKFMCVNAATLDNLVTQMPDPYASMSDQEFFAELYALYYDLDDPQRGAIPPEIGAWLSGNIGVPAAATGTQ